MSFEVAQIAAAARDRGPRADTTCVIAIDGPAGSGKTTLAALLAAEIPGSAVLNTDQLYPGWGGLENGAQRLVSEVLGPISSGAAATFTVWDWQQQCEGELTTVPASATLIIDGAGSGSKAAEPFLSFLIWVDAERSTRESRAIGRDGEMFAPHWESWAEQERALFEREQTRERADLIIITNDGPPQSV